MQTGVARKGCTGFLFVERGVERARLGMKARERKTTKVTDGCRVGVWLQVIVKLTASFQRNVVVIHND